MNEWKPPTDFPRLRGAKHIAVDCETRDPELKKKGPGGARGDGYVIGVSVATDTGVRGYWPIRHEEGPNVDIDQCKRWLADELSGPEPKIGANVIYDLEWLRAEGIHVAGPKLDVQIAEPLLNEELPSYSLQTLAERYLGESKVETGMIEAAAKIGIKEKDVKSNLWRLPSTVVGPYGEADADLALRIFEKQQPRLEAEELMPVFDLETGLVDLLLEMRFKGIPVDVPRAEELMERLITDQKEAQKRLNQLARAGSEGLDVWSGKQLADACRRLKLEYPLTDKGNPSLTAPWLTTQTDEFFQLVLNVRQLDRYGSVFIQSKILDLQVNGRVHPVYYQTRGDDGGTRSGRFSAAKPNPQQVPTRNPKYGKLIRSLFIPEDGCRWLKADWCFSSDTEVLTNNGFKLFKDLQPDDLVAQYMAGRITYSCPLQYQRIWYEGEMVQIRTDRHVDLMVSPNHNCLLATHHGREFMIKASDYDERYSANYQLQAARFEGIGLLDQNQVTLLCATQADAAFRLAKNPDKGSIRFKLKKPRKIVRLQNCLDALGIRYTKGNSWAGDESFKSFVILKGDLPDWFWNYIEFSHFKAFKRDLLSLDLTTRQKFLQEVKLWDGNSSGYCSTIKINAEIVHEMAILSEHRSHFSIGKPIGRKQIYYVSISSPGRIRTNLTYMRRTNVPYSDFIYCVTMPYNTIVVRRNGKVSITGQSQQEPRITIHYAGLLNLTGAAEAVRLFNENPRTDYHQMTADMSSRAAGREVARVKAKGLNLGLAYGMGRAKLATELNLSEAEAATLFKAYHTAVGYMRELGEMCANQALRRGYVKTILSRRCHFNLFGPPGFGSRKRPLPYEEAVQAYGQNVVRYFVHKAMNRVIQGSGADAVKKAMLDLYRDGYVPHVTVHDELDFSIETDQQIRHITETMANCLPQLTVPLVVDAEVGRSWGELEKLHDD